MNQQDQLAYLCDQVQEIGARARRIETKVHKHLGIDIPDQSVAVNSGKVLVNGHDVTLSQIKRALEERDWFEVSDTVQVCSEDGCIATVTFLK